MVKMKKVLVLSSSPRKGGNSDILCDEFILGAKESGNDVEKIFLKDKKIIVLHVNIALKIMVFVFKKMIWLIF